ncbi:hypothetical protein B4U80_13018 [Leptotrombidium deliense]|uniref:Uncharacterized protein n=1 Tax=Leptotrombidium deliense TaxID=299467 RepID=A0A443SER5_9ACAR|nr:hypothetical protein B4U80_13018 [Leptotrombidium deliense]
MPTSYLIFLCILFVQQSESLDIRLGDINCSDHKSYRVLTGFRVPNGDIFILLQAESRENTVVTKLMPSKDGKWFRLYDGFPKSYGNWMDMFGSVSPLDILAMSFIEDKYLFTFYKNEIQVTQRKGDSDSFNVDKVDIKIDEPFNGWKFESFDSNPKYLSVTSLRNKGETFIYIYRPRFGKATYDLRKITGETLMTVGSLFNESLLHGGDVAFTKISNTVYTALKKFDPIYRYHILTTISLTADDNLNVTYPFPENYNFREFSGLPLVENQEYQLLVPESYLLGCPIDNLCVRLLIDDATKLGANNLLIFSGRHVFPVKSLKDELKDPIPISEYFGEIGLPFYVDAVHTEIGSNYTYIIKDSNVWTIRHPKNKWEIVQRLQLDFVYPDLKEADASISTNNKETFFFIGKHAGVWRYDVTKFPFIENVAYRTGSEWVSQVNSYLPDVIDAAFRAPDKNNYIYLVKNNYFYAIKGDSIWHTVFDQASKPPEFLINFFGCDKDETTSWSNKNFYDTYYKRLTPVPSDHIKRSTPRPPPYTTRITTKPTTQSTTTFDRTTGEYEAKTFTDENNVPTFKNGINFLNIFIIAVIIIVLLSGIICFAFLAITYASKQKENRQRNRLNRQIPFANRGREYDSRRSSQRSADASKHPRHRRSPDTSNESSRRSGRRRR